MFHALVRVACVLIVLLPTYLFWVFDFWDIVWSHAVQICLFIYSFILIMNLINALVILILLLLCNTEMVSGTESEAGAERRS